MPIYEYQCKSCKKTSSFLLLRATEPLKPCCKFCGNKNVLRLISCFSIPKSEGERIEGLLDPSKFSGLDENDPASIGQFLKKMEKDLGDNLGEGFSESLKDAADLPPAI